MISDSSDGFRPLLHACRNPDDIAFVHLPHGTTPFLNPARTGHDERLASKRAFRIPVEAFRLRSLNPQSRGDRL
jgi:hypothetical protein